ncbi:hypothetical protein GGX14DRAFT_600711 [Mycena pura]|uniref:DUF6534 domain-containing protein n=1 Tax=Mycena pura TaxID=153505 RepID=A0AAD6UN90_9AGAR|nr:hypothetical protein GGX14DRAFT_600711 [Mycena pura]
MSDTPPPPPFPLDGSLGACIIGAVLGTFLYGLETLQTYTYYRRFPSDPLRLKVLVAGIWIVALGQGISVWHALYKMIVSFFGQIDHTLDPPHSLEMAILFAAIGNVIAQTFFALRIRTLSGNWYIPALCSALTVARFALNMIMLIAFWQSSGFQVWRQKIGWAMLGASAIGAVVDVITATALCVYLYRLRSSRNYYQRTRRRVDTLILWSVETTTVISAVGVLQLIFFLATKDLAWMTFFLLQPIRASFSRLCRPTPPLTPQRAVFANSIVAHLNGRERPGKSNFESGSRSSGSRGGVSTHGGFGSGSRGGGVAAPNRSVVVRMHHTTEIEHDEPESPEPDNLKSLHDPKLHQL